MYVDLRHTRNVVHCYSIRRCGVLCQKCNWRGFRRVRFLLNLSQRFDGATATGKVKGLRTWGCPQCGGSAVFTHAAGPV